MFKLKLALAATLPVLLSCTAMGAWVYDDPSFALKSVNVRSAGMAGSDSLELVFVGCNRNDYDLMAQQFLTRLAVGGRMVGEGGREQPIFFGTRDTSQFTVTMALSDVTFTRAGRAEPFELTVHSAMTTPIGSRAIDFRLRGRVQQTGSGLAWFGEAGRGCRPGTSQLPGVFDPRPVTAPPPPAPPRNGPGLRPERIDPPLP